MGLKVCCLGSGSSGNCIYVASASTVILIDQGLPVKRVDGCLKALSAPAVPSVIVTHSHADHICQIPAFVRKHGAAVYCATTDAYLELARRGVPANRLIRTEGDFIVGDITVSPFAVSHDVPCVGYGLYSGGCKVSVATDLGRAPERVLDGMTDSDLVVLECNHDEELVLGNAKYTAALKRRILSAKGHLSNAACGRAAVYLAEHGVRQIILAHLSKENNYPELAESAVREALAGAGCGRVRLEVAPPDRMTGLYEIIS